MSSVHLSKWNWINKCNIVTILELKYNYCWHKQLRWKLPSRKMKLPLGLQRDTDSCDLTDKWYGYYDRTKSKEDWRRVKGEQDKCESVNALKRGERARSWRKTMEGEWLTGWQMYERGLVQKMRGWGWSLASSASFFSFSPAAPSRIFTSCEAERPSSMPWPSSSPSSPSSSSSPPSPSSPSSPLSLSRSSVGEPVHGLVQRVGGQEGLARHQAARVSSQVGNSERLIIVILVWLLITSWNPSLSSFWLTLCEFWRKPHRSVGENPTVEELQDMINELDKVTCCTLILIFGLMLSRENYSILRILFSSSFFITFRTQPGWSAFLTSYF